MAADWDDVERAHHELAPPLPPTPRTRTKWPWWVKGMLFTVAGLAAVAGLAVVALVIALSTGSVKVMGNK
jgi:hypothetical protein